MQAAGCLQLACCLQLGGSLGLLEKEQQCTMMYNRVRAQLFSAIVQGNRQSVVPWEVQDGSYDKRIDRSFMFYHTTLPPAPTLARLIAPTQQ